MSIVRKSEFSLNRPRLAQSSSGKFTVIGFNFYPDEFSLELCRGNGCCARAKEWVQHDVVCPREKFDKPSRQSFRKRCAMRLISTLCGEMKNICWISHVAANPIFNFFPKSAAHSRFIAALVSFAEIPQTCVLPISHRDHDRVLVFTSVLRSRASKVTRHGWTTASSGSDVCLVLHV